MPGEVVTEITGEGAATVHRLLSNINTELAHINDETYQLTVDADSIDLSRQRWKTSVSAWRIEGTNQVVLTADTDVAKTR